MVLLMQPITMLLFLYLLKRADTLTFNKHKKIIQKPPHSSAEAVELDCMIGYMKAGSNFERSSK
jgi:hypothetical protein